MIQKICAGVILLCLLAWNSVFASWDYSYETSGYLQAKINAAQTEYGKKYNSELEAIIPTLSSEKLSDIQTRVQNALREDISQDLEDFLSFIWVVSQAELLSRSSLPENAQDEVDTAILEIDLSVEQINESDKEIEVLQNMIGSEIKDFSEIFLDSLSLESGYEQNWDFSMNISALLSKDFAYNLDLSLDDYRAKSMGLDSAIEGNLSWSYSMNAFGEELSWSSSWDIHLISKDGTFYIKTNDIEINLSEELSEEATKLVDALKKLWKDDIFLEYQDLSSQYISDFITWLSSQKDLSEIIDTTTEKKLFEAYAMKSDSYLIRPTKEFCSLIKQTLAIFDPFSPSSCSDSQYKKMLKDFSTGWFTLLLTPWDNKNLRLEMTNNEVEGYIEAKYSNYGLISFIGNIYEPNNSEVNAIDFRYIPEENMQLNMKLENTLYFTSSFILWNNNSIEKADIVLKSYDYWDVNNETSNTTVTYNKWKLDIQSTLDFWYFSGSCEVTWILKASYWDIKWSCSFDSEDYFTGEIEEYNFSTSGNYNMRNNRNDVQLEFSLEGWVENIIVSFFMENIGTMKEVKNTHISVPEKTKDLWEFLEENEIDFYPLTGSNYDDSYFEDDYSDYTIEENTFPEYEQSCYIYENGESICYNYYDTYTEYCYDYTATTGENYCDKDTDEYYFDGYNNIYYYDEYEINGETWEKTIY